MPAIIREQIIRYVEKYIQEFHDKRLSSLKKLKLGEVLRRKNPYLFKAKNINTAETLVKNLTDAYLSSQEEGLFGNFLEGFAIFICEKVYQGKKSSAEGIDLEFDKRGTRYLVTIKSGPNWGNSQQIRRMIENFKQAKRILGHAKGYRSVLAVNGCCYGKEPIPNKGDYIKLCGQDFWAFISGKDNLYTEIVEPLGYKAKEKNGTFLESYAIVINRFTQEFMQTFCVNGRIDWKRLVRFNSGRK